jgi:hypothetical protein
VQKQVALKLARKAPVKDPGISMCSQIALGVITRERCCDGKARFTTYDYAARVGEENGREFGKVFDVYACPFCDGYHLFTVGELTA